MIELRGGYMAIIEVTSATFCNITKQGKVNCRKIEEDNQICSKCEREWKVSVRKVDILTV